MTSIQEIINHLEQIAPLDYQEKYDNAGLIVGDANHAATGILICLDITEAVLVEAKEKNCNLIIAHHPIIFHPIKKLIGQSHVEKCIIQAIKQDVALYAMHTNLDNLLKGVNKQIAQALKLHNLAVLLPKKNTLSKLVTFVPEQTTDKVLQSLYEAGAGNIGQYTKCSFVEDGIGSFQPAQSAHPHLGKRGKLNKVYEKKIEVAFPTYLEAPIIKALLAVHPYKEVAYSILKLENLHPAIGSGMIGQLEKPLQGEAFLKYLKSTMNLTCIRHSPLIKRPIKNVALCGGAGIFLLQQAIKKQADVLVTADVTYHDFFNAEKKILIADIGHYESEVMTKGLIYELLYKKFTNIAIIPCETLTNPIHYF